MVSPLGCEVLKAFPSSNILQIFAKLSFVNILSPALFTSMFDSLWTPSSLPLFGHCCISYCVTDVKAASYMCILKHVHNANKLHLFSHCIFSTLG